MGDIFLNFSRQTTPNTSLRMSTSHCVYNGLWTCVTHVLFHLPSTKFHRTWFLQTHLPHPPMVQVVLLTPTGWQYSSCYTTGHVADLPGQPLFGSCGRRVCGCLHGCKWKVKIVFFPNREIKVFTLIFYKKYLGILLEIFV